MPRFLLLAALLLLPTIKPDLIVRPTSRFTYKCDAAPALRCTFTSTSLGAPASYRWDWGDGRTETHTDSVAKNTWTKPALYIVRLDVYDSIGGHSYSTQKVQVGPPPCTCVDTVRIHDTIASPPVVIPPTTIGGARLATGPTTFVDTRYLPPTGRSLHVAAGQSLQAALDSAQSGDVVLVQAGATFVGPFTLKPKRGMAPITVRSDAPDAQLPPAGTRMAPSYAALLPKLVASASNNLVITTAPRASNYRLMFLEVAPMPGADMNTLVRLGSSNSDQPVLDSMPSRITLDRVYLHGLPTNSLVRAVQLHGAHLAVVDSYLSEIHANGQDSQAIVGWNGPGPYKIVNNFLAAAGENVLFGGADPLIPNIVASDIVVSRNYVWKDPAWKVSPWNVKNHLEIKVGQRMLIEGNVFEHCWVAAQSGLSILLKSTNQSGGYPNAITRDIVFRSNIIRDVVSGITIAARDGNAQAANLITIDNNLIEATSGIGIRLNADVRNIAFLHNTLTFAPSGGLTTVQFDRGTGPGSDSVSFVGNLLQKGTYGVFGLDGAGGEGAPSLVTYHAAFTGNAMNGVSLPQYPTGNTYPTTLAQLLALTTVGVDFSALAKATGGVSP